MKRSFWIFASAALWLVMGSMLFYKGVSLVSSSSLFSAALIVGFFKGKFVLAKRASKIAAHIHSLEEPVHIRKVYPISYLILIACMIALGVLMRFVSLNVRGFVDVAVGAALLRGTIGYFAPQSVLQRS